MIDSTPASVLYLGTPPAPPSMQTTHNPYFGHVLCSHCGQCVSCHQTHLSDCPDDPQKVYQRERQAAAERGNVHLLQPRKTDGKGKPYFTPAHLAQLDHAKQLLKEQDARLTGLKGRPRKNPYPITPS